MKFNPEESKKTLEYVERNDTRNRRCNRCGSVVLMEPTVKGYPYQCMNCDENLYEIETHIGEKHTDEEYEKLCCNTRDLLLLDDESKVV
ncbi:MAG: hypothetical protein IKB01_01350 [Lachnospiraceae bacterium]|nr:hypothetical protein [Lachnospiraceae bacterium]